MRNLPSVLVFFHLRELLLNHVSSRRLFYSDDRDTDISRVCFTRGRIRWVSPTAIRFFFLDAGINLIVLIKWQSSSRWPRGWITSAPVEIKRQRGEKKDAAREARTRVLRAHAPVGDQNVIVEIKETVAGGYIYVYMYVRTRINACFAARWQRERDDFEGVTRQEAILEPVLLINEPPESVCTFLRFVGGNNNRESLSEYQIGISSLASDNRLIVGLDNACMPDMIPCIARKAFLGIPFFPSLVLCLI